MTLSCMCIGLHKQWLPMAVECYKEPLLQHVLQPGLHCQMCIVGHALACIYLWKHAHS